MVLKKAPQSRVHREIHVHPCSLRDSVLSLPRGRLATFWAYLLIIFTCIYTWTRVCLQSSALLRRWHPTRHPVSRVCPEVTPRRRVTLPLSRPRRTQYLVDVPSPQAGHGSVWVVT